MIESNQMYCCVGVSAAISNITEKKTLNFPLLERVLWTSHSVNSSTYQRCSSHNISQPERFDSKSYEMTLRFCSGCFKTFYFVLCHAKVASLAMNPLQTKVEERK